MLSSKLCEGGLPTVQINDIRYDIFQVRVTERSGTDNPIMLFQIVMQFLYQGGCQALEPAQDDILELMAAANFFQLDGLLRYCENRCASMLALDNVVSMYIHAKVYNAVQLLEYCQGFLLQNMVALLTYDDSVKRLLFAKKLPNHDVLAGLLNTLQNRIKTRKTQNNFKINQNFQNVNK
jgi:ankyrin repeat/BTB/POZ domain-containing protein 2